MKSPKLGILFIFLFANIVLASEQIIQDNFEGNGTITTWEGDQCGINTMKANPYRNDDNSSATVLEYSDFGGQFANVRFDLNTNLNLTSRQVFTLKIFVPSEGLSGSEANQVSLKLQNRLLFEPWSTQSEIIKSIVIDQWQTLEFDFLNDSYINLDQSSLPPTERSDFNRVVIQVNGENNNETVKAYLDDVSFGAFIRVDPTFDLLVWSDEFNNEGPIDQTKWHHQTKLPTESSWYNGEIQHYTNREENTFVSEGLLHIVGKKEKFADQGVSKEYTSARLNSKFAFKYGRIEVRAKLPTGTGTWPAIWTLGKNINEDGGFWDIEGFGTTPWPVCGEIDIIEHWGDRQNFVQSAAHTPSSFGTTFNKGGRDLETASIGFHTYAVSWYPEKLVFSIDEIPHYIYAPSNLNKNTWPFDKEQYILLNFAFLPSIEANFTEDTLSIDFVRVYQESQSSSTKEANQLKFDLKITPNPSRENTTINYQIPKEQEVKLLVYDLNGHLIQTLVNQRQRSGQQEITWNISDLPSGIYLCTLKVKDAVITKKFIVN